MATLRVCALAEGGSAGSGLSLREWLDGRWAILFSHPEDFVRCELELDRWLVIVGNAFEEAHIRPLALSRRTRPIDRGWVSQLSGDERCISLPERMNGRSLLDFHASRLRACLEHLDERFAMIIDPAPCQRRTLLYEAAGELPSPLDLVHLACRLRSAARAAPAAPGAAQLRSQRPVSPHYSLERYVLGTNHYQIELLASLDQVPESGCSRARADAVSARTLSPGVA